MKGIIKRIIAIILVLVMVLMCGGCSVSVSEEAYELYLEDPHAYMDEQLGEDNAWGDFWAGPIGRLCMAALVGIARRMEANENESLQGQTSDEDVVNMLSYNTYGVNDLFDDYDWEYMERDLNLFMRVTGFISHGWRGAKAKYKEAFRAYIKEFIVENEYRYATEISFEEEKTSLRSFLQSTKEIVADAENTMSITTSTVSAMEYAGLIEAVERAQDTTELKKMDGVFTDLLSRTVDFAEEYDIKLFAEVEVSKTLKGAFDVVDKVGKATDAVFLLVDVSECVKTYSDVLKTQKVASEFFELTEIFETIVANTTNTHMKTAAEEILEEIKGGQFKDLDDLLEREATKTIITFNPYVAAGSALVDTAITIAPKLRELDTAYSADAIRHIKMACCELLKENTENPEGYLYYYKEENKEKVDVYLQHCLYSQLVWTYTINKGEKQSSTVLEYARLSGVKLPKIADNYKIQSGGGVGHTF